MARFVDEYGVDGFTHVADRGGSIWRAFQITAQPSFIFINDNGSIRRHIGSLSEADMLEELELLVSS